MTELLTRKRVRLQHYDYSTEGMYFVTICSKDRNNLFGKIVGADGCRPVNNNIKMELNEFGLIVEEELKNTENIRNEMKLDQYIVMPNHLHVIITIECNLTGVQITGRQPSAPTDNIYGKQTLSSFVAGFKSVVTKRINILRNTPRKPVWQRSFYDHIITNERSLNTIREYIKDNPENWDYDIENQLNISI